MLGEGVPHFGTKLYVQCSGKTEMCASSSISLMLIIHVLILSEASGAHNGKNVSDWDTSDEQVSQHYSE